MNELKTYTTHSFSGQKLHSPRKNIDFTQHILLLESFITKNTKKKKKISKTKTKKLIKSFSSS